MTFLLTDNENEESFAGLQALSSLKEDNILEPGIIPAKLKDRGASNQLTFQTAEIKHIYKGNLSRSSRQKSRGFKVEKRPIYVRDSHVTGMGSR